MGREQEHRRIHQVRKLFILQLDITVVARQTNSMRKEQKAQSIGSECVLPEHVGVWQMRCGVSLLRVNEAWEQDGITKEEDLRGVGKET